MKRLPTALLLIGFGLLAPARRRRRRRRCRSSKDDSGASPRTSTSIATAGPATSSTSRRRSRSSTTSCQSADVQIVTRQQTGSGGNEYTLSYLGLKKHEARTRRSDITRTRRTPRSSSAVASSTSSSRASSPMSTTPPGGIHLHQLRSEEGLSSTPSSDPWAALLGFRALGPGKRRIPGLGGRVQLPNKRLRRSEAMKFRLYAGLNFNHRRYEISGEAPILTRERKSL